MPGMEESNKEDLGHGSVSDLGSAELGERGQVTLTADPGSRFRLKK